MTSISVIGLDVSDKKHEYCTLSADGAVQQRGQLANSRDDVRSHFCSLAPCRVVLEAGTHSPWLTEVITDCGHEVIVANPRRTRVIWQNTRKSDRQDAELLARLGRADSSLLSPIRHRSSGARADLALIRSRGALVQSRSALISHVRGVIKSFGYRLPGCTSEAFARKSAPLVPKQLRSALMPVMSTIATLTVRIRQYDRQIDRLSTERYPESQILRSVHGVGPITALAFVLVLEEPNRFTSSRSVAAYLGLVPRRDQSGETDKRLPISKSGDVLLRCLLVNCAQYILGPFGRDSALRRWGKELAERGGGRGKLRAVIAVARKLAVVLHKLWRTGQQYQPFPS
jgi:transposase